MSDRITIDELKSYLWNSAVLLRTNIDAGAYKQYIFPLLFFKRICDVYDEETAAAVEKYGEDVDLFDEEELHTFVVPKGHHWNDVRIVPENVGIAIVNAFHAIESANIEQLHGVFGGGAWTNKNRLPDALLKNLIEHFSTKTLSIANCPEDELGQGYAGTSHTSTVHHYYICNNRKKKLCSKKNVRKEFIEQFVIAECRKLLTAENIERIAREVVAISESERDTATVKRLNKLLKDNERKKSNLMSAIMECDSDVIRKTLYEQIPMLESEKKDLELQLVMEEAKQVKLTVPEVKFFLNALKKGNADSIKHQKTLIAIFVNAIYLYDDKITRIFNSRDKAVTVDADLLNKIEKAAEDTPTAQRFVYEQLSSTISALLF